MKVSTPLLLALLAAAVLGCLVVFISGGTGSSGSTRPDERALHRADPLVPSAPPAGLDRPGETLAIPAVPRSERQDPIRERVESLPTVGDVLRDFWGPRWSEIEPKLEGRISMSARMDIELPPWHDVQPLVCDRLKFTDLNLQHYESLYLLPAPLTVDFLQKCAPRNPPSPWTEADVLSLESHLADSRRRCSGALLAFRQAIDTALAQRCVREEYDHAPITNIEERFTPAHALFVTSFAVSGWVISCGISPTETPEIALAARELQDCKAEWRDLIARYSAQKE